jgi:hypothetical protein
VTSGLSRPPVDVIEGHRTHGDPDEFDFAMALNKTNALVFTFAWNL